MSETTTDAALEREDVGDVTVLRMKVPTLYADEITEALFDQSYAVVEQSHRHNVVLSLEGVGYFASMALGKLVRLMQKTRQAGGKLVLCKLSRPLVEVLRITHLADILLSYDDEQQAIQSFQH